MKYNKDFKFPENFLWGASSAAWQVEGATEEGGRTPAIIDLNSKTKKPFKDNSVAADHYHRYKEDVQLMKEAGFSSYRFSIAWPRIYPNDSGIPNQEGIDFYNNLINELIDANITPIVTLYHYDMPVWVDDKYNGWYGRGIIDSFDQYVRTCFKEFGDRVKYWLAINEQNMQIVYGDWLGVSKGSTNWFKDKWEVNHIMNLCHAKAVNACHELVEGGKIGPVPGYVPLYPYSSHPDDQIARLNAEELTQKIWNDTNFYGEYSEFIKSYWREHDIEPTILPGDLELMKSAKIDYIALNCYRSQVARWPKADEVQTDLKLNATGKKGEFVFPVYQGEYALEPNPHTEKTDWDWEIDPVCMRYSLRELWNLYQLPIVITEGGFSAHEDLSEDGKVHDQGRIDFLREHIKNVGLAIQDGVEVFGFNPWSFTDLLSTGNGMAKRYGLVFINTTDFEDRDLARIPKDSYYWYSNLIKTNGEELFSSEE